jgi:hypothetical protein
MSVIPEPERRIVVLGKIARIFDGDILGRTADGLSGLPSLGSVIGRAAPVRVCQSS